MPLLLSTAIVRLKNFVLITFQTDLSVLAMGNRVVWSRPDRKFITIELYPKTSFSLVNR